MSGPAPGPPADTRRQGLSWRDRDHTRGRLWVSLFVLAVPLVTTSLLQGAGDAATPLLLSVVQTAISIVAEYLLIFGKAGFPELGIGGVAWGVAAGQVVSLALAARVLLGGRSRLHLHWGHLRPDFAELGRILRISWPPALQMVSEFIVTVFFLRMVGDFGAKAQAAYSIGLRLGMVGPMLAFPMAGACATLVGQNLGAGSVPRAWRALGVGLVAHVALLWSVAAILFWFRTPIVAAFTDDPEVIRIGSELLIYQAGQFVFWAFYFVFIRGLQGAGDVRVPMLLSIGNALLVTLPLGVWLALPAGLDRGPTGIFEASLVGSLTITLTTGAWLTTGRWARGRTD